MHIIHFEHLQLCKARSSGYRKDMMSWQDDMSLLKCSIVVLVQFGSGKIALKLKPRPSFHILSM